MTALYWWRPTGTIRSTTAELVKNGSSWVQLLRRYRSLSNFGDEFNVDLFTHFWSEKPTWAAPRKASVFGVGSVLNEYFRSESVAVTLGSGLRNPKDVALPRKIDEERFPWVRGELTKSALGLTGPVLGDPGLLAPDVFRSQDHGRSGVVLLPHFSDFATAAGRRQLQKHMEAGHRVLTPNRTPRDIATAIQCAGVVVTSSLHGVVFSDAFGIPVIPTRFADGNAETQFKYEDYSSAIGSEGALSWIRSDRLLKNSSLGELQTEAENRTRAIASPVAELQDKMRQHLTMWTNSE